MSTNLFNRSHLIVSLTALLPGSRSVLLPCAWYGHRQAVVCFLGKLTGSQPVLTFTPSQIWPHPFHYWCYKHTHTDFYDHCSLSWYFKRMRPSDFDPYIHYYGFQFLKVWHSAFIVSKIATLAAEISKLQQPVMLIKQRKTSFMHAFWKSVWKWDSHLKTILTLHTHPTFFCVL